MSAVLGLALLCQAAAAPTPPPDTLARDILAQLVAINTSDSARHTDQAAHAMERRLLDAGFPAEDVRVLELTPGTFSLVARYRGRGAAKPILMLAHLDVVDARREDWSLDPWTLTERDGYYYGRGSSDDKAGVTFLVANFIRLRREGFVPSRDLIIALTGDEETTSDAIRLLVTRHRDLVDADFALNADAGGGELQDGRPLNFSVQTAEKVYLTFQFEARSQGGHSSVPEPDNAIYRLAHALERLSQYQFPVRLTPTTRAFFERAAATQPPDRARDMLAVARNGDSAAVRRLSRDPYLNALLRTTCVATRLFAGHADNALPQMARATVNCRLIPTDSQPGVQRVLQRIIGDTGVAVTVTDSAVPSPPSPLREDVMGAVEAIVAELWPGAVVVPEMSTGATDGLYARNAGIPTYGVFAVFDNPGDNRIHGRDERILVASFNQALAFWYRLVRRLAG